MNPSPLPEAKRGPALARERLAGLARPALLPGRPWPMGAHFDGQGVNFCVFSAHASQIDLCLFDSDGQHEIARTPLPAHTRA